jgi:hypothetical protein
LERLHSIQSTLSLHSTTMTTINMNTSQVSSAYQHHNDIVKKIHQERGITGKEPSYSVTTTTYSTDPKGMFPSADIKPVFSDAKRVADANEPPPSYSETKGDEAKLDSIAATLPPPSGHPSKAFLPILIPQGTAGMVRRNASPFARAYPTQLEQYGIGEAQFMAFVDGFNEAYLAHPIYQVMGAAGGVCTAVPSVIAHGVGAALIVGSIAGSTATTILRSKAFIKKANRDIFAPRGLLVRVRTAAGIQKILPELDLGVAYQCPSSLESSNDLNMTTSTSSTYGEDGVGERDLRKRRLSTLEGQVAPLKWDVVEPQLPSNLLKKMGARAAHKKEAKLSAAKPSKKETKLRAKIERKGDADGKLAKELDKTLEKKEIKPGQAPTKHIRWIVITPIEEAIAEEDEEEITDDDESEEPLTEDE